MKIKNLPKLFAPSNSKLDIDQRFHRVGDWTIGGVNVSWMIKTYCEPKTMANLKDKPTTLTDETIANAVKTSSFGTEKLVFDETAIYLTEETPVACFLADNSYVKIYVNAYYLSFFLKTKTKGELSFWGRLPDKMIVVRDGDTVIGAIAPVDMTKYKTA